MNQTTRSTARHATALLLTFAFLGLFLAAHCISHAGHDDDHAKPCPICQVWSIPFVAASPVELAQPAGACMLALGAPRPEPLSLGFWLASPIRPPPSSSAVSC